ncbi:MBL fold metallo-hydrolase [Patescibacteria group bacterium]
MEQKSLVVGALKTNCYLVWDKKNLEALIIDPGDAPVYLAEQIQACELKPKAIIATHGHFDHVLAVWALQKIFKIPFLIHCEDQFILDYMQKSARFWLKIKNEPLPPPPTPDRFLKAQQQIKFGTSYLEIMSTPGHTPGSICLYNKKRGVLFSGDTLFAQGWGRTDLPGGSEIKLKSSLRRLLRLPPQTKVLPGHEQETTILEAGKFSKFSGYL